MLDELRDLQVFYINIGGGEPMVRRDFFELVELRRSATASASSSRPTARSSTPPTARRLAAMDYLDIQISLDGIDAATNDAVRGDGSYAMARRAMDHLADAGFGPFKISVVVTRHNVDQLDELQGAGRLVRRAAAGHPTAARRAAAPTRGTTCTRPTTSSARSTAGCSPTATTCSPATRSSTSTRSASRCPG